MNELVDLIKEQIPDYAKDIRLNLDSILKRSNLDQDIVLGCALAASFASKNEKLVKLIAESMQDEVERDAALTAAALMAMNNVWYPFVEMADDSELKGLPAGLRMNAYSNFGGTTKDKFEAYALAASIVGKCHFCVKSHYNLLKKEGWTVKQLQDVGKISAIIATISNFIR